MKSNKDTDPPMVFEAIDGRGKTNKLVSETTAMRQTTKRAAALILILTILGCGGEEDTQETAASGGGDSKVIDFAAMPDPCALLTPEIADQLVGAAATKQEGTGCRYENAETRPLSWTTLIADVLPLERVNATTDSAAKISAFFPTAQFGSESMVPAGETNGAKLFTADTGRSSYMVVIPKVSVRNPETGEIAAQLYLWMDLKNQQSHDERIKAMTPIAQSFAETF